MARLETAVEQMGHPLRRDAAAGVTDGQPQSFTAFFQFHRDGAAGRCKFQRVGKQVIKHLLHGGRMNGADPPIHGADKFQLNPQLFCQIRRGLADLRDQLYQISVPQRQRLAV